jgi:hypothetical protein
MAKDQTVVFGSPFKFGFFAGLGFFVASTLMTVVTFVLIGVLGFGTLGAIGAFLVHSQNQQNSSAAHPPKAAMAVSNDGQ